MANEPGHLAAPLRQPLCIHPRLGAAPRDHDCTQHAAPLAAGAAAQRRSQQPVYAAGGAQLPPVRQTLPAVVHGTRGQQVVRGGTAMQRTPLVQPTPWECRPEVPCAGTIAPRNPHFWPSRLPAYLPGVLASTATTPGSSRARRAAHRSPHTGLPGAATSSTRPPSISGMSSYSKPEPVARSTLQQERGEVGGGCCPVQTRTDWAAAGARPSGDGAKVPLPARRPLRSLFFPD